MNEHEQFVHEMYGGMVAAIITIASIGGTALIAGAVLFWWLSTRG